MGHGGRLHREIHALPQLVMWVEFLASTRVRARFDSSMGLQLYTRRRYKKDELIVCAVVDKKMPDPHSGTKGADGAWLGPAALVNSSCKKCANSIFKVSKGMAEVWAARPLKGGEEVLVPYEQEYAGTCQLCGGEVTHVAREDVEESSDLEEEPDILPVSKRARRGD